MRKSKKEFRIKLKLMENALYHYKKNTKESSGICELLSINSNNYLTANECRYLNYRYESTSVSYDIISIRCATTIFHELKKYEPKHHGAYWWNVRNRRIRIKIMTELIEFYKEQLK